jgi:hypothetical protein
MTKTVTSLTVAVLALFGAQAATAQTQAPTREEVKKEAAAANKAGSNVPGDAMGQQSPKAKAATSTTTRDDRKKDAAAANKAGAIPDSGTAKNPEMGQQSPKAAAATSTTTRDDRKKDAAAETKAKAATNVPAEATTTPAAKKP